MFYIKRVCNFIHSAGNLTEMNFFKAGEMKTGRIHNEPNNDGIVISGISGKFPKSKNMAEFASNLLNKVKKNPFNMVESIEKVLEFSEKW